MGKPDETVLEKLSKRLTGTVVIVGVGNPLRGDDGVGPLFISRLEGKTKYHLLDCGETPEHYLRDITAKQPDVLMLVDAARLGSPPGSVEILEPGDIGVTGLSTHNMSLGLFIKYIKQECDTDVFMLAFQPATREFGAEMSKEVADAVDKAIAAILAASREA